MRLSSLEADEVDREFLKRTADCERLVPHFHLCLQSGSDSVLARMRRRYRSGAFLRNVEAIRERFDRPALTTDVIVGFPGETEAEFAETERVCRAAGFSKIHVFPFSPRAGTPAATFGEQVPAEVKEARSTDCSLWIGRCGGSTIERWWEKPWVCWSRLDQQRVRGL